ncbi:MAG: hypothetical protein Q7R81_04920 [Candidatus Peregrinibacteria bacterium]|nr:hypothetical protein [Candidatus Peregrinibacteria bacterium]
MRRITEDGDDDDKKKKEPPPEPTDPGNYTESADVTGHADGGHGQIGEQR